MDDMRRSIPASPTRRSPGSKTRRLAVREDGAMPHVAQAARFEAASFVYPNRGIAGRSLAMGLLLSP